jgi:hypothetical protein
MPLRKSPTPSDKSLAARRTNALKSTGPRTDLGKLRVTANMRRNFRRLLGLPEAVFLDQEPGAAIHLYHELISPYAEVPPLLAMHFRELARLELELQAWEGIRDAEMEHRTEQTALEARRHRFEVNREVSATTPNLFETGLCRQPASAGKFRDQSQCLAILKDDIQRGEFSGLEGVLGRLYGKDLNPEHERGQLICAECRALMKQEGFDPLSEQEFQSLLKRVEEEEHDVTEAWGIELLEKSVTPAARRARLAPTREDHWMNRQGDRLRQAIDRKMRFTVTLLKVLGLGKETKPTRRRRGQEKREIAGEARLPKLESTLESE